MSDRDYQVPDDPGRGITLAFEYIQRVYHETAQLMGRLDDLVAAEWPPARGNLITSELSRNLNRPDDWLATKCFRIYSSKTETGVRRGITVVYCGEGIDQPILIGGQLDYILGNNTDGLAASGYAVFSTAWLKQGPEDKLVDGSVHRVDTTEGPLKDRIRHARLFAIPLVSIQSQDDIRTEVYGRLMGMAYQAAPEDDTPG